MASQDDQTIGKLSKFDDGTVGIARPKYFQSATGCQLFLQISDSLLIHVLINQYSSILLGALVPLASILKQSRPLCKEQIRAGRRAGGSASIVQPVVAAAVNALNGGASSGLGRAPAVLD